MTGTATAKPVILFVDDEETLRSMFIEMMPKNLTDQIDFRVAEDGAEALAIIEETREMLIGLLTDLGLGAGPNGNIVAKAALDAGVKHVAICTGSTGYSKEELIHGEIRSRIQLMTKPYGISDLMTFIEKAIQSSA